MEIMSPFIQCRPSQPALWGLFWQQSKGGKKGTAAVLLSIFIFILSHIAMHIAFFPNIAQPSRGLVRGPLST